MHGYIADIEKLTEKNTDFRHVLYTGKHLQLVVMALNPGESIGVETHATHDQFFRIEQGKGVASIDGVVHNVNGGDCVIVPAGAVHNLTNSGDKRLHVYTLYAPPEHQDSLVQSVRPRASSAHDALNNGVTEPATR
jgi:mannose-6-phosphate isomerase-like protein (cupin superfamily)